MTPGVAATGSLSARAAAAQRLSHIWKPLPAGVRIFYKFVIYHGYDMDILSVKSYDVIYHRYDMDIPNANNLEWLPRHIFFDFWINIFKMSYTWDIQITKCMGYLNHKYFRMSYLWDI